MSICVTANANKEFREELKKRSFVYCMALYSFRSLTNAVNLSHFLKELISLE